MTRQVGRLVAEHFTDPTRLASLGAERFIRYAQARGLTGPTPRGGPARDVLAADLALLQVLDGQISAVDAQLAGLLPATPFLPLLSVPGWSTARVAAYGAGVGDPGRWPGPRQIYRASGLSPSQYESAGRRRDGSISREGSVELRRALIGLGNGLWLHDSASKACGRQVFETVS